MNTKISVTIPSISNSLLSAALDFMSDVFVSKKIPNGSIFMLWNCLLSHSLLIRLMMLSVSQNPSTVSPPTQKFITGPWPTSLTSFICCFSFNSVSLEMLKLRHIFSFSCFSKAIFSQIFKWFWMSFFWQVLEEYILDLHLPHL